MVGLIGALVVQRSGFGQERPPDASAPKVAPSDDAADRAFKSELSQHQVPFEPATLAAKDVASAVSVLRDGFLSDAEVVVGLTIGSESRAYPIKTLAEAEALNDVLGGVAVVVTWCRICHAAVVYDRKLDERTLTMGNYRCVWRGSLVMYDVETGSMWVQASGDAHAGPLRGRSLAPRAASMTTWGHWRAEHPDSSVALATGADVRRRASILLFEPVAAKELGIVARAGGAVAFFPLADVAPRIALDAEVGGVPIVVVYSQQAEVMQVFRRNVDGATLGLVAVPAVNGSTPLLLAEDGGKRRWLADSGRPYPADARWPALERVVAYPLRTRLFEEQFPARERRAPPSGRGVNGSDVH